MFFFSESFWFSRDFFYGELISLVYDFRKVNILEKYPVWYGSIPFYLAEDRDEGKAGYWFYTFSLSNMFLSFSVIVTYHRGIYPEVSCVIPFTKQRARTLFRVPTYVVQGFLCNNGIWKFYR